jgi:diacylglycerol kinase (ATP)
VKIIILFNPAAGRGRARRKLQAALEVLRCGGVDPEVCESRSSEHLRELAREAVGGQPDMIISAGGDGTHHHVINGLCGTEVPLGMIPLGTGNDIAAGLGIPTEARAAAAALMHGRPQPIDLGRIGSRVYCGMAGVGIDSMMARYVNEHAQRLRGRMAYFWALARCLRVYRPQPLELHAEGVSFSGDVMAVLVGNHAYYGGGFHITPCARSDDGLLDVCLVPTISKLSLLPWIPRAYHGTHLAHPRIQYFQTSRVTLSSSHQLDLYADGEFIQPLPASIEAMPRALNVVVPA